MSEMLNNRNINDASGFYNVMDEYYGVGETEKHLSPTKRLISMKNSTADHKQIMKDNI